MQALNGKNILLVVSGGIAAYKSLELVRLIRKAGGTVRCILTKGGAQFVTPLSLAALSENPVYEELFSLKDETEMGHIRLSREADLIIVAPASANMIAKMACGMADDLASTALLAADKPVLIAPAMNHVMWENPATQDNIVRLRTRGIMQAGPETGAMACNETGMGRMAEPEEILGAALRALSPTERGLGEGQENKADSFEDRLRKTRIAKNLTQEDMAEILGLSGPGYGSYERGRTEPSYAILNKISDILGISIEWLLKGDLDSNAPHTNPLPTGERGLKGRRALVTSGPTFEPLDPVRFIGNRSSGKQGHAIAAALAAQGAEVTLVSGPVSLPDPAGVTTVHVETAVEMLDACRKALPADIAVCAAAVSDWSAAAVMTQKIKKKGDRTPPDIKLKENPDILVALAGLPWRKRPSLVIGFAAETENLLAAAREKRAVKGCDWIIANEVGPDTGGAEKVFGADENHVYLIAADRTEDWQKSSKQAVAGRLAACIARHFAATTQPEQAVSVTAAE